MHRPAAVHCTHDERLRTQAGWRRGIAGLRSRREDEAAACGRWRGRGHSRIAEAGKLVQKRCVFFRQRGALCALLLCALVLRVALRLSTLKVRLEAHVVALQDVGLDEGRAAVRLCLPGLDLLARCDRSVVFQLRLSNSL